MQQISYLESHHEQKMQMSSSHQEGQTGIFYNKNFVKACVGAIGPDWGFPEL